MPLGIYISVPFCRSKCSFCNFASGVFSRELMSAYVARVREEIVAAEALANKLGAAFDRHVDSIYLGGGTPTTLSPEHLKEIFSIVRGEFEIAADAEITVEAAPGTLGGETIDVLADSGVNRVSLGVQSFVDQEIRSVGRLHTAAGALVDIERLREFGIANINIDLIAGLPHQTAESWQYSLQQLANTGVPHASVYILEVDEDSRLGRELIAGGSRYHAHAVPDPDLAADVYLEAIEFLRDGELEQYEISNFARSGHESRHNLKYWTRQPYLGFGLDAHSMLYAQGCSGEFESLRFSHGDELAGYLAAETAPVLTHISAANAAEERLFLGLRLNRGIPIAELESSELMPFAVEIRELIALGLLEESSENLRLTSQGRLLSNEVFERFIRSECGVSVNTA
ncbi:MAG TPA: radical SAM family heme chaperone HemW [Terriglobales bacterium]|nr:radical SAM family heme chaperone HemW [Terriglobales bacterium]